MNGSRHSASIARHQLLSTRSDDLQYVDYLSRVCSSSPMRAMAYRPDLFVPKLRNVVDTLLSNYDLFIRELCFRHALRPYSDKFPYPEFKIYEDCLREIEKLKWPPTRPIATPTLGEFLRITKTMELYLRDLSRDGAIPPCSITRSYAIVPTIDSPQRRNVLYDEN